MDEAATFQRLQELGDSEFHKLCDQLLPRLEHRYRHLVPHGINLAGKSVKGHPDSYVGDTAQSCRIAFEYSTQKKNLIGNIRQNIRGCKSRNLKEIVFVTPLDIDRPNSKLTSEQEAEARSLAEPAEFRIIGGRVLSRLLDSEEHQDLRRRCLGIPFSEVSWHSLMDACRRRTEETITQLISLKRYEPDRYIERKDDRDLLGFWQRMLTTRRENRLDRSLLLPLVGDSGIGKTSLLCRFGEKLVKHYPILLIPARNLNLTGNNALTAYVLESLRGVVSGQSGHFEEKEVARAVTGRQPLTVLLDGLDEASSSRRVRQAIQQWLMSRLGQDSLFIVSSRPAFWSECWESDWERFIPAEAESRENADSPRRRYSVSVELPKRFQGHDALKAWLTAGCEESAYWNLEDSLREELRHPFAMRTAVDIVRSGGRLEAQSRIQLMDQWLSERLETEAEADLERFLDASIYRSCLKVLARQASALAGGWMAVDKLNDVPRFDPQNPPGTVVRRLVQANILQAGTEHPNLGKARFTFEAVQDFFLAETDIEQIAENPSRMASQFGSLPLSRAVLRLEFIANLVERTQPRETFVRELARIDPFKAAIVIQRSPHHFTPSTRSEVINALVGASRRSRFLSFVGKSVELLSFVDCADAREAIPRIVRVHQPITDRLRAVVANAALRQNITKLAEAVYQMWWFVWGKCFADLRARFDRLSPEMQNALASLALAHLSEDASVKEEERAITVLGYLSDERAVDLIRHRYLETSHPRSYAMVALLAVGTDSALQLFREIVEKTASVQSTLQRRDWEKHWYLAVTCQTDLSPVATEKIEDFVLTLMRSWNRTVRSISLELARWMRSPKVAAELISHLAEEFAIGLSLGLDGKQWLSLWENTDSTKTKRVLITLAAKVEHLDVEAILIQSLTNTELVGPAARSLAGLGCIRAAPQMREALDKMLNLGEEGRSACSDLVQALEVLRDAGAVEVLKKYAATSEGGSFLVAECLGFIGTDEAEEALLALPLQDRFYVQALVNHGGKRCIERAIDLAEAQRNGAKWLLDRAWHGLTSRGWSPSRFRELPNITPLLHWISKDLDGADNEFYRDLIKLLEVCDGKEIRDYLRRFANLAGSKGDVKIATNGRKLSSLAFETLADRGDSFALPWLLEHCLSKKPGESGFWLQKLRVFDRSVIVEQLLRRLEQEKDVAKRSSVLTLIGRFGDEGCIDTIKPFIEEADDQVANAAYEAYLRLHDPLQLPEYW